MGSDSGVCLIVPADEHERLYRQLPLDVAYVAAALRERQIRVEVWDQRTSGSPPDFEPAVTLVTTAPSDRAQCYPLNLGPARRAVEDARAAWPSALSIGYGPHANHLPLGTLESLGSHAVARGENESAALAAYACAVGNLRRDSWSPRQAAERVIEAGVTPVEELPLPAYDLLPLNQYVAEGVSEDGIVGRYNSAVVLAARGCPYRCTFCHLPFGDSLRTRPIASVTAEVDALTAAGLRQLFFLDYVFGLDRRFYGELCESLKHRDLTFVCQTRPEVVVRSDLASWHAAGCRGVWLGAESVSVADAGVRKPVSTDLVERSLKDLVNAGIVPFLFILIGLPGDTEAVMDRLTDWVAQLSTPFTVNQLVLRPGTELYDDVAPTLFGGRMPQRWEDVEAVNDRYRAASRVDLDRAENDLALLPNHLAHLLEGT